MFKYFQMDFEAKEFKSTTDIAELTSLLERDWPEISMNMENGELQKLNSFLQIPDFLDAVERKGIVSQLDSKDTLMQKIYLLGRKTHKYRTENYASMSKGQQRTIRRLNRTLLESLHSNKCPHKTDVVFIAKEWFDSLLIAFVLAMFIRTFFFQAFRIPSGSMRLTLIEGDKLIVNKLHYGAKVPFSQKRLLGFSEPEIGDVIVFIYPEDPKRDFIKRLIAKGGDEVEIKFGDIYINGELVENSFIKNTYYYNRGSYGLAGQKVKVPEGHYFTLGDNSGSSSDSRYWGFVPENNIIGKASIIYWPPQRIRFIK